jgi:hypothetical protein
MFNWFWASRRNSPVVVNSAQGIVKLDRTTTSTYAARRNGASSHRCCRMIRRASMLVDTLSAITKNFSPAARAPVVTAVSIKRANADVQPPSLGGMPKADGREEGVVGRPDAIQRAPPPRPLISPASCIITGRRFSFVSRNGGLWSQRAFCRRGRRDPDRAGDLVRPGG